MGTDSQGKGTSLPDVDRGMVWSSRMWDWLIKVLGKKLDGVDVGDGLEISYPRSPLIPKISFAGAGGEDGTSGGADGESGGPGGLGCYERLKTVTIVCKTDGTITASLQFNKNAPVFPCGAGNAGEGQLRV